METCPSSSIGVSKLWPEVVCCLFLYAHKPRALVTVLDGQKKKIINIHYLLPKNLLRNCRAPLVQTWTGTANLELSVEGPPKA